MSHEGRECPTVDRGGHERNALAKPQGPLGNGATSEVSPEAGPFTRGRTAPGREASGRPRRGIARGDRLGGRRILDVRARGRDVSAYPGAARQGPRFRVAGQVSRSIVRSQLRFLELPGGGCCGSRRLVANTAKYVGDAPIVAINPDPTRFDGVLLPFRVAEARRVVGQVLENRFRHRPVTLAEVSLNDGQTMLAFNDFFVGAASHVSARYILEVAGKNEPQSSSGLLVSTGAGSTGWLSSVFNMAVGVAHFLGTDAAGRIQLDWEDPRLVWAVREPFISKHSRAELIAGLLDQSAELTIESVMPSGGVIFSDGIESDFLPFNTGTIARIAAAKQRARIVVG